GRRFRDDHSRRRTDHRRPSQCDRLYARRARPLPEDADHRSARLPRPFTRTVPTGGEGPRSRAARTARARRRPDRHPRIGQSRQPAEGPDRRRPHPRPAGPRPRLAVLRARPRRRRTHPRRAQLLRRLRCPVLFSSHQLDLVERLVDDLVIINEDRLVAAGTAGELRRQPSLPEWTLHTDSDLGWVREMPDVSVVELDGNWVRFTAPDPTAAEAVLRRALTVSTVSSFAPHTVALNRLFQEVTQS